MYFHNKRIDALYCQTLSYNLEDGKYNIFLKTFLVREKSAIIIKSTCYEEYAFFYVYYIHDT